MSLTLSQIIQELQCMRQVLPADAPVRAWLLSPAAGVPEMAVLEICGVTGGVDRRTGRLCTTLQLRLPHGTVESSVKEESDGSGGEAVGRKARTEGTEGTGGAAEAAAQGGDGQAPCAPGPLVHEGGACPWW